MGAMGRSLRSSPSGYVYNALNRGNGRAAIVLKEGDYEAFERIMIKALEHVPGMRLLAMALVRPGSSPGRRGGLASLLKQGYLGLAMRWLSHVNKPLPDLEVESIRRSVGRGQH